MKYELTSGIGGARKKKLLVLLASSSLLAGWGGQAAFADDDAAIKRLEAEIHRIEQRHQEEISALRAEIHHLRHAAGGPIYVTKGEVPPPGGPHVIETTKNGVHFGFADADGQNTVELTGRLHLDTAGYVGYHPAPNTLDQTGLASGINLRRARIGVTGNFLGDWHYTFIYDFGNTSDGYNANNALANGNSSSNPATSNNYLAGVENAYITYNGFYKHGGPFPVAFDFGFQDVPWTLEESTSSNDLLFVERATPQVLATAFGGGDFRSSLGFHSNNDRYWLGAYLTGPNSGALHTDGASCVGATAPCTTTPTGLGPQLAALFRASYQIVQTPDASLHLGFDYANLFDPRVGANQSAISLSDRPEERVDPSTFLATGNIPARGGQVFGGEAAATWQNFFVQGEYYHYTVATQVATLANLNGGHAGPTLNFNGGYVEGSYTFGGKRRYNPASGAYTGVIPDHPLAFGSSGWGALEVAGRFSATNLNDPNLTTTELAHYTVPGVITTASYGGGTETAYGGGLNWYPNGNLKFMLDYEHYVVDQPAYYGGPNSRGATIDWIGSRTQIVF